MLDALLKIISWIPLPLLHRISALLGCIAYACGSRYRTFMQENLRNAGFDPDAIVPELKRQLGMQAAETAWVWKRSNAQILKYIEDDEEGMKSVNEALAGGKSLVFMTPHVGCYEVAPVWIYEKCLKPFGKKFTVLYREPKFEFLRKTVARGRLREGMDPAPADLSGVRKIVRAMRAGGVLGCLPDQVPGRGEGVWVPFFGRLAFTMGFPLKMARQFDAVRFIVWTERVPTKGWRIFLRRWDTPLTGDAHHDAALMNELIEETIRKVPTQYIWNYNRFKRPAGAAGPTEQEKAQIKKA